MTLPKRVRVVEKKTTPPHRILNSKNPEVSVIIPLMNERRTIARVIANARKVHPKTEVIVVANGSRDGSSQLAKQMGAKMITYKKALGHDVGRSIGAKAAKGNVLLFLDGDIVFSTNSLKRLVHAVKNGVDVALNKYNGTLARKNVHSVVLSKYALNNMLSLPHLKGASLTTIPHALSRKALEKIGAENLTVPPKAQTIAANKGLVIKGVHYFEVGKTNPRKRRGPNDPLKDLIIGDHLEAIQHLLDKTDPRGGMTDLDRNRKMVK
ncbi:glycosyltransferase family 2 protein [Paenibacillus germinis]|uniref:glycosyltransferase family 2 protein n=1 Tax=Paenibacillus germinis TaxID=2654979 RepID=UPI001FEC9324|nr:glycosyltransferase [Paenibacillus germinis]